MQKKQSVIDTEEELSSVQLLKSADRNASVGKSAMDDIQMALHCVPAIYRVPFPRYFEGYKYEEIALEQSIPLGTVKTHIQRHLLKKHLKQYRPD